MKDAIQNELNIGDYVVYPSKYADELYMKLGRVVKCYTKPDLKKTLIKLH